MGMNPEFLDLVSDLCRTGRLRPPQAVLDIGASELYCADDPDAINRLLRSVEAPIYGDEELARMADRAMAAALFRRAGFRYTAIDYARFPGILRLDLNVKGLPWRHRGRYQFVANCGTSEHILNQLNVFKVIHQAGAPGAFMFHEMPAWGDYEHGLFGYSPKFFWELATANDYKWLRFTGRTKGPVMPIKEDFARQIAFDTPPVNQRAILQVLLQKQHRAGFRILNDPAFDPELTAPRRW